MTTSSVWVTLKQHRFELGVATLGALALACWALFIELRLAALNVPSLCVENWLNVSADGRPGCAAPMEAWGAIVGSEGARISEVMRILPFAVGLLAGVPIVGRELEAHTAQTAWSLNPSRTRWLARQAIPISLLVLGSALLAAIGASAIEAERTAWGEGGAVLNIGLSGLPAIGRVFGAFGIGLLLGALLGRSVPALVLGAFLCFALVVGLGAGRDRWLETQKAVPIEASATSITTGWAWRDTAGELIPDETALARVPQDISILDAGQVQPIHSLEWLELHGYVMVPLGVPQEAAMGWIPYDVAAFSAIGLVSMAGAVVLVNRRRPA